MKTKPTKSCFVGPKYAYRDSDIDKWLPKEQEIIEDVRFISHSFDRPKTFKEFYGDNPDTFSLVEIENLIDRTDKGEDCLKTDGRYNFFPVKSKDGISVVHAIRNGDRRWYVGVDRFDDECRWIVEFRFFSRNSTLKPSDTSLENRISSLEGKLKRIAEIINE